MFVLMRTETMQSALCVSMKPIPPISEARLNTYDAPAAAASQASFARRSLVTFSTPSCCWYQRPSGLMSTARMRSKPRAFSSATRCPPMNPPPPVTAASLRRSSSTDGAL
jgi:hypothetical protein